MTEYNFSIHEKKMVEQQKEPAKTILDNAGSLPRNGAFNQQETRKN